MIADYATDLEPGCSTTNCSTADKGLQMLRQSSAGCTTSPAGSDAKNRIHWWATKRLQTGAAGRSS